MLNINMNYVNVKTLKIRKMIASLSFIEFPQPIFVSHAA